MGVAERKCRVQSVPFAHSSAWTQMKKELEMRERFKWRRYSMDQGLKEELGSRACVEGWVWPCHAPGVRGYTIQGIGISWGACRQKVDKILIWWLLFAPPHTPFFFLSWMRHDVTARRVPNGEPRDRGKFKARKTLLSFGSGGGREVCKCQNRWC